MSTVVVGTVQSNSASPPTFKNTSGTEIGTLCRAFVNFNGTGTVAIRASFNVSSITDNGTGDYTVNFTNALPDANYCWSMGGDGSGARLNTWGIAKTNSAVPTVSALRVQFYDDTSSAIDTAYACVKIHR